MVREAVTHRAILSPFSRHSFTKGQASEIERFLRRIAKWTGTVSLLSKLGNSTPSSPEDSGFVEARSKPFALSLQSKQAALSLAACLAATRRFLRPVHLYPSLQPVSYAEPIPDAQAFLQHLVPALPEKHD